MNPFDKYKKYIVALLSVIIGIVVFCNIFMQFINFSSIMENTTGENLFGSAMFKGFFAIAFLMVVAAGVFLVRKIIFASKEVKDGMSENANGGNNGAVAESQWIEKEDGTFVRVDAYSQDAMASENAPTVQKVEKATNTIGSFVNIAMNCIISLMFGGFGVYAISLASSQSDPTTIYVVGGMFAAFGVFNIIKTLKPLFKNKNK